MSNIGFFQLLLDELGAELGLGKIPLNSDGQVRLHVGPLDVSLVYESEPAAVLWMIAPLGDIRDDQEAAEFVMELGFVTWLQAFMTLALEEDGRHVRGFTAVPTAALDRNALRAALETFVANALEVRHRLTLRDYRDFDLAALAPPGHRVPHGALRP